MKALPRVRPLFTLSVLFLILATPSRAAYEAGAVKNGGTITGTVTYGGEAQDARQLEVTQDQNACGVQRVADETVIVKDGMVQNVVVSIEGIEAGKEAVSGKPALNNVGCRFVPHVQTMQVGSTLLIENTDPVLHNTHGTYEAGRTAFNIALPIQNQKVKKRIRRPGTIHMKCDAGHTWMSAYVVVFEHPYHAVTGEDGSFMISDVPAGTHSLSVWHEKLGSKTVEVTVEAGGTASIEIELELELESEE